MSDHDPRRSAVAADPLAQGLRALTMLARRGPLDLAGFARSSGLHLPQAAALIDVFEGNGLVRRMPDDTSFVVTPLATALIGPRHQLSVDLH